VFRNLSVEWYKEKRPAQGRAGRTSLYNPLDKFAHIEA
jgi:hypothetical protein